MVTKVKSWNRGLARNAWKAWYVKYEKHWWKLYIDEYTDKENDHNRINSKPEKSTDTHKHRHTVNCV